MIEKLRIRERGIEEYCEGRSAIGLDSRCGSGVLRIGKANSEEAEEDEEIRGEERCWEVSMAVRRSVRRLFLSIAVSAAAGAVLAVAMAWVVALYGKVEKVDISYTPPGDERRSSWSRVPAGWEFGTHVVADGGSYGGVVRYELVTEMVWAGSTLGAMSGRPNRSVERVEVGWPVASMEWVGEMDHRRGYRPTGWVWQSGFEPPIHKGNLYLGADRRLPLMPVWPGFAVSALVCGAPVWIVWFGGGVARRAIRRRRGLCAACGYPRGVANVCSECGRAFVE